MKVRGATHSTPSFFFLLQGQGEHRASRETEGGAAKQNEGIVVTHVQRRLKPVKLWLWVSQYFFFSPLPHQILKLRLREAEQQRLRAEVERQRQVEGRERLRNLNTIQEEVLQLNQQLDPSTQSKLDVTPSGFSSFSARGNQLCSQVSEVVRKTAEVS